MSDHTKQGDLFGWNPQKGIRNGDVIAVQSEKRKPQTIEERFEAFHQLNPHVAQEMLRIARARIDRGETYISVKALWEELRMSLQTIEEGGHGPFENSEGKVASAAYKLNNIYTSMYARLMIKMDPRLERVIELRKRKGE